MNNEAESSGAGPSHVDTPSDDEDELDYDDVEEEARMQAQRMKERRLDAKRKRVLFLDKLLRELDSLMFVELVALYHLEYVDTTREGEQEEYADAWLQLFFLLVPPQGHDSYQRAYAHSRHAARSAARRTQGLPAPYPGDIRCQLCLPPGL